MNGKMYAADLMTVPVRSVRAESGLSDALRVMDEGGYGQVPVVEGDRPVKLLTERDARHALQLGRAERPVGELASPLPCLLAPEAPLSEVLQALQEQDSLLIVGPEGRLEGIITYWDVLRVARPNLLVAEAELLLRKVVADSYREKYGEDWWPHVREDLRGRAEEEHRRDQEDGEASSEHMLGHTSFWSLIEIFREIRPDLPEERYASFHEVRKWRNQVAHLYILSDADLARLIQDALAMRDFLEPPPERSC
ncbi:MAG: CBS domain-containing protein [Bacillota bacterium]